MVFGMESYGNSRVIELDDLLAEVGESVARIESNPNAAYERVLERHGISDIDNLSSKQSERLLGVECPSQFDEPSDLIMDYKIY